MSPFLHTFFVLFLSSILVAGEDPETTTSTTSTLSTPLPPSAPTTTTSVQSSANCFASMPEADWSDAVAYNQSRASLVLRVTPDSVLECLQSQTLVFYRVSLLRQYFRSKEAVLETTFDATLPRLLSGPDIEFGYVIFPGKYRLQFVPCAFSLEDTQEQEGGASVKKPSTCDAKGPAVESTTVARVNSTLVTCDTLDLDLEGHSEENYNTSSLVDADQRLRVNVSFWPCVSSGVLPYETALLTLYTSEFFMRPNCSVIFEDENESQVVETQRLALSEHASENGMAFLSFASKKAVPGERYYCLKVELDEHPLCSGGGRHGTTANSNSSSTTAMTGAFVPSMCQPMITGPLYVDSRPWLAAYIPYCSSHLRCGWIYVLAAGTAILVWSCLLAICAVYCCCCCGRRQRHHKRPDSVDGDLRRDETIPFEGLCLKERKTWSELHTEWDRQPPKNPGKLLLLYSPDTRRFKQLQQQALKSFLETACHCIVLDLFDDELFQTIAFNPEQWLTNLLKDPDFKIVVISSQGAYKRQQALMKGEVLNIPENNSPLDGLFSAGLKFIQEQHAYDVDRLAMARYEMLHLTSAEFRLESMVPNNREFLIPTQLHELFCWIHGYDPLDLLGKPWDRYHLELQLLQDELKQTRLGDRPPMR